MPDNLNQYMLEVINLSKKYSKNTAAKRRIGMQYVKDAITGKINDDIDKLRSHEFWALRNVSLRLKRGEALGVIGFNGSGKTTFLRMLAGHMLPDAGEIKIRGKTGAMIDLTAGFRGSQSGRQNILLRAAMQGISRHDVHRLEQEIIDFSELEEFIDSPVETYSQGMRLRLAFAVNIAIDPQLLLIDEVLAVGDFHFRQKCLNRMRELRKRCSFVFVSHNMNDVSRFCDKVLVLNKGIPVYIGQSEDAIAFYHKLESDNQSNKEHRPAKIPDSVYVNSDAVQYAKHVWMDSKDRVCNHITSSDLIKLRCEIIFNYIPNRLAIGVPVWDDEGVLVTGFSTETKEIMFDIKPKKSLIIELVIPKLSLAPGRYHSYFSLLDGAGYIYRKPNEILEIHKKNIKNWGLVNFEYFWNLID